MSGVGGGGGGQGTEPPSGAGGPPRRSPGRMPSARVPVPPAPLPVLPDDDVADRPRTRISSSSLKRLEGEEKEMRRRGETVHIGLRLTLMGVIVIGLFSIMLVRLWSLQVLQGPSGVLFEKGLSTRTLLISPPRGLILARNGQVLVANKVMTVVTLDRQDALNDPGLVQRVAVALGTTTAQINADLNDQQDSIYEPVPVAVGVSPSTILFLSEHRSELPGVVVSYVAERSYPQGDFGVQMLGYVGDITAPELKLLAKDGYLASDVVGQSGIEEQYEQFLRGKSGKQVLEVDAFGDAVGTQSETAPTPGDDVILNIDESLQVEAQHALASQLASLRASGRAANSGAVVVLDPQNGAVLAMVSIPSYNPEWFVGGISTPHWDALNSRAAEDPLLNRAIAGEYQPGSSFKLVTATAALHYGIITPYSYISDPGSFTIPHCKAGGGSICTFYNNAGESCGSCDLQTAITMSDDVFFYNLGFDFFTDPDTAVQEGIQKEAAKYGFGRSSGIDLPGASYGQVDGPGLRSQQHKEDPSAFPYTFYGAGDALETAFGQGETLVTPLQIAEAYATFANGGTRYAPEVAAAVVSPTGKVVKVFKPRVLGHVNISPENYSAMLAGLEGVITSSSPPGTAYAAFQGYPYSRLPIAGKTGTATTSANPAAQPTAVFVAFGPVTGDTRTPKYCVAAIIPGAGYGASAAAPVVRQIFEFLIHHPVGKVDLHPAVAGG